MTTKGAPSTASAFLVAFLAASLALEAAGQANDYAGPPGGLADNSKAWLMYCKGKPDDASSLPSPNYSTELVLRAGKKLSLVDPSKLFLPKPILLVYGFFVRHGIVTMGPDQRRDLPDQVNNKADAFLSVACGEYRDRASMLQAKLKWWASFLMVDNGPPPKTGVWNGLTLDRYQDLLEFSNSLYAARWALRSVNECIDVEGNCLNRPVQPISVCELRHILNTYVLKDRELKPEGENVESALETYQTSLEKSCGADDNTPYLTFRGGRNLTPYTPESQAMMYLGESYAAACRAPTRAKADPKILDRDCDSYYSRPFSSRYLAARAGVVPLLFHHSNYHDRFADIKSALVIRPHQLFRSEPFGYSLSGKRPTISEFLPDWLQVADRWARGDMGFNEVVGRAEDHGHPAFSKPTLAYERLRCLVERHSNWERMSYEDPLTRFRKPFYTPLVASSYYIHDAEWFSRSGDGWNWMTVYTVSRENVYNAAHLKAAKKVDFDLQWFDERSLGDEKNTEKETGWDRLGTALETELFAGLYLRQD